jgi:CO/xanthine dehydrogenase FAD-binding subunit
MREVFLPYSLPELFDIMENTPEARIFAGGTDLLVQLRTGDMDAPALIGVERIADLKGVREESGWIWIGAGSTHGELLKNSMIRQELPILVQALETLGSPPIRNMGTIGGNVCTASPAGDALPPLYVLDAEVAIQSPKGKREIPLREFITGPGLTALKKEEILTGIRVKKPTGCSLQHYEKVGQRRSLSCAIASLAALIRISKTGIMETVRFAWGSVAQRVSTAILEEAAFRVRQAVSPIDDVRATAAYRREVSGNLLLRLIPTLMKTAGVSP